MNEEQPPVIPIVENKEEISYDAAAPVKGQGRMDAAWGSSEGDEDLSAQVSPSKDTTGFVFEQVYQPWNGTLNPRWMRNWAILRHHVAGIFKKAIVLGVFQPDFS